MEPQAPPSNHNNLRLLCSFGGRITPLPPTNSLHYIGGETRVVVVPRDISLLDFFELLSSKFILSNRSFAIKYRLHGFDIDSLITVDNDDDLQNMILEYDFDLSRRLRLFLFPLNQTESIRSEPARCCISVNQLLGLE
ncbi:unnamed protein product [Cochlearia groenlandica]